MKKFKFRLDTVLKVRKEEEDKAQQHLTAARVALHEEEEAKKKLEEEGRQVEETMRFDKKTKIDAQMLVNNLQYMEILRDHIAQQQDEVLKAKNIVNNRCEDVKEAMKKRKAIGNLKDKQYAKWQKETEAKERAFLDEQATMRYYHSKKEGLK